MSVKYAVHSHSLTHSENGLPLKEVKEKLCRIVFEIILNLFYLCLTTIIITPQYSGVVGQVQRQEVSMGAGQFSMMEDRMKVVEFSSSFGEEALTILMRSPTQTKAKNIAAPFSPLGELLQCEGAVATCNVAVWLLIVGSSLLMTAAMFLLISVLDRRLLATTRDTGDRFSLGQLVWFIWSALVKQGSVLAPRGDVSRCKHYTCHVSRVSIPISRILFGTWWIFITIVTAFYTAQLTVVLSSPSFNMKVYSRPRVTCQM